MSDALLPPMLDVAHFRMMTGDDPALQAEVIALFAAQAERWRERLAPEAEGWRDVVHTIKGAARGIGLWRLAEACAAAEASPAPEAPARLADVLALLELALGELAAA
jgi:HPt (histidine-containing phosphotransfer) domain-containing protein